MAEYTNIALANARIDELTQEVIRLKAADRDRQIQFNDLLDNLSSRLEGAHKTAPVAVPQEMIDEIATLKIIGYTEVLRGVHPASPEKVVSPSEPAAASTTSERTTPSTPPTEAATSTPAATTPAAESKPASK